jgi:hypothetical protein
LEQFAADKTKGLEVEARRNAGIALKHLELAAAGQSALPTGSNHLRAFLYFELGEYRRAAESWKEEAEGSRLAGKMLFNQACALAKALDYRSSLDALDNAVQVADASANLGGRRFDVRSAAHNPAIGAELAPFWADGPNAPGARAATSTSGRTFDEIVGTSA